MKDFLAEMNELAEVSLRKVLSEAEGHEGEKMVFGIWRKVSKGSKPSPPAKASKSSKQPDPPKEPAKFSSGPVQNRPVHPDTEKHHADNMAWHGDNEDDWKIHPHDDLTHRPPPTHILKNVYKPFNFRGTYKQALDKANEYGQGNHRIHINTAMKMIRDGTWGAE